MSILVRHLVNALRFLPCGSTTLLPLTQHAVGSFSTPPSQSEEVMPLAADQPNPDLPAKALDQQTPFRHYRELITQQLHSNREFSDLVRKYQAEKNRIPELLAVKEAFVTKQTDINAAIGKMLQDTEDKKAVEYIESNQKSINEYSERMLSSFDKMLHILKEEREPIVRGKVNPMVTHGIKDMRNHNPTLDQLMELIDIDSLIEATEIDVTQAAADGSLDILSFLADLFATMPSCSEFVSHAAQQAGYIEGSINGLSD